MIQTVICVTLIGLDHRMAVVLLCLAGVCLAWDFAFGEGA